LRSVDQECQECQCGHTSGVVGCALEVEAVQPGGPADTAAVGPETSCSARPERRRFPPRGSTRRSGSRARGPELGALVHQTIQATCHHRAGDEAAHASSTAVRAVGGGAGAVRRATLDLTTGRLFEISLNPCSNECHDNGSASTCASATTVRRRSPTAASPRRAPRQAVGPGGLAASGHDALVLHEGQRLDGRRRCDGLLEIW
jgi:hypothetical protein